MNGVRRFDDFVLLLLLLYIMHFFRFIKNVAYYNIVQYFNENCRRGETTINTERTV